jgi:hypothetical protein
LDHRRLRGRIAFWHPIAVHLNLSRLPDVVFQLRHRLANIVGGSLDVVRRRGADVCMSQDSLDHHIRHTQAV